MILGHCSHIGSKDTPSQLFAKARNCQLWYGAERCYYCLGSCDRTFAASKYVKKSFTARDTVGGGAYVCGGCVAAMDESATIQLPDDSMRDKQKIRCYSWVVTRHVAVAATKAHRKWLLEQCLTPPRVPFVISISDSGQKHLLYRAVVCYSKAIVSVTLEGEQIHYEPMQLRQRVVLCNRISAVIGKPSLSATLSYMARMRLEESYQDDNVSEEWLSVCDSPLSRLAAWFALSKKEAQSEYSIGGPSPRRINDEGVQTTFGWSG